MKETPDKGKALNRAKEIVKELSIEDLKGLCDIRRMIELSRNAHLRLLACLEGCTEEDLAHPIPTRFHGQSAAHFFWIMAMHDISHGAQIRTIRRAFGTRTDYYDVRSS